MEKNYLEELLKLTKENEGENSNAYLQVSSEEWQNNATENSIYLLLSMEKAFNDSMKNALVVANQALSMKYWLDNTKFQKVEFGKLEDETIWVLVRYTETNQLYSVILKDSKNGDKRDYSVINMKEL